MNTPTVPPPTIAVTGQGRRFVNPDQVEFRFTLNSLSSSVREAEDALQRQRTALFVALSEHRNFPARLTADGPFVTPHHDYEQQRYVFKGFKTVEHVILRAPIEPGFVNTVLHAVALQLETVSLEVRFTAQKTAAARRSARAEAVRNARRKAAHFAEAAGQQLGCLLSLSEPHDAETGRHENVLYDAAESTPVEIDPETEPITAEIHAVWELKPA